MAFKNGDRVTHKTKLHLGVGTVFSDSSAIFAWVVVIFDADQNNLWHIPPENLLHASTKTSYQPQPPPPGSVTLPAGGSGTNGIAPGSIVYVSGSGGSGGSPGKCNQQLTFDPALLDNVETGWIGDYPTGPSEDQVAQWKRDGRCPECGELGHFSHFALVCSKHGPYT